MVCEKIKCNLKKKIEFDSGIDFSASQSDILLKSKVTGVSLDQCSNLYQRYKINLSDKQLCAGGEDDSKDSCNGDSGDSIDFQIEIHGNSINKTISTFDRTGGPLMAADDIFGNSYKYLVGIVSFGPRLWLVKIFFPSFTRIYILNVIFKYVFSSCILIISGTRGFPSEYIFIRKINLFLEI